jgi:hypothetical protein
MVAVLAYRKFENLKSLRAVAESPSLEVPVPGNILIFGVATAYHLSTTAVGISAIANSSPKAMPSTS